MSLTISGIIVSVVGTILAKWGFSETCANELVTNIPLIAGGIMAWIGRWRKGDITALGFRK